MQELSHKSGSKQLEVQGKVKARTFDERAQIVARATHNGKYRKAN